MIIEKIVLKNFKCFPDLDINLSKITVLTGENSSGKSSFIYGLLSAFQSENFPFYLSPNGKYVNMGDFIEMSFNNIRNNKISLSFWMKQENEKDEDKNKLNDFKIDTTWVINQSNKLPKLYKLVISTYSYKATIQLQGVGDNYVLNFEHDPEKFRQSDDFERNKIVYDLFNFMDKLIPNEKTSSDDEQVSLEKSFKGLIEIKNIESMKFDGLENIHTYLTKSNNAGVWRLISNSSSIFKTLGDELNFISSFRLFPERTYYQQTRSDKKVGEYGLNYIDQILEWESTKDARFDKLKDILRNLQLLRTIRTKKFRGGRFELRVQVKSKGLWASLADVGFGISQFLPIVVADLQLPKNSYLIIAQPEIHLHPSIQANLADYFIEQSKEMGKKYIIETHSEYFLNRLRLAIVEKTIKPSDVSIYFFENTPEGTQKHKIEFTENGQIKNAPKGFFETYMMDVMEIAYKA